MELIEKALEVIQQHRLEEANLSATPIAQVGAWFCASKGVSNPKPEWFNPFGRQLFIQQARSQVDPEVAKCFLRVLKNRKVPSWVIAKVNLDLIKAAAEEL